MKKFSIFLVVLLGLISAKAQFGIPPLVTPNGTVTFGPNGPNFSGMQFIYTPGQSTDVPAPPANTPNVTTPSQSSSTSSTPSRHKCRVCVGTGEVISEVWFGSAPDKWCSKCGKSVYPSHTHKICETCGGTGWVSY